MEFFEYDRSQSYRWNYDHAPIDTLSTDCDPIEGDWEFCGLSVDSPLGIAAGPLLNGKWCLYYARLGFDVLTYKTVRSRQRDCYDVPNLVPVDCESLDGSQTMVNATETMRQSWAVSFGMPSATPDVWRRDVENTRKELPSGKLLSVSVVGTMQDGWGIDELAEDYAQCAAWAIESGADCVETNFSCPNVDTCDGQLYQNCESSKIVAQAVRSQIGDTPYIIKIGHMRNEKAIESLLTSVADDVNAVALTNSIAAKVKREDGLLFGGQQRGICGAAIREESIAQTTQFKQIIERLKLPIELIGIGGISTAEHVKQYLDAGAATCQLATAAMLNPAVAIEIRSDW